MLKTTYEGEELTHRLLWRIVEQNAKIAAQCEEGWFYPVLVCEVFAFHAIEAYINFIGDRIAPEIWNDERNYFRKEPYRGWDGKLRKILELVGLSYERDKPPMSTIMELRNIRDLIAHGKPETIAGEVIHLPAADPPILPASTLTTAIAAREDLPAILADVERFLDAIHTRAVSIVQQRWGRTDKALWFGKQALRGTARYSGRLTTLHRPSGTEP
jgi:hypothetical protein